MKENVHIAPIVRFREACPRTVRLSYKDLVVDRVLVRFKVLMQPDKRKFDSIAANCKNTMYKTLYVDKKYHEKPAVSINAQISIGATALPMSA